MAAKFPPALMKLFQPRPPPPFIKPTGPDPDKQGPHALSGVAATLQRLREEEDAKVMTGEGTEGGEKADNKVKLAKVYEIQANKETKKKQQEEYKRDLEKNCGCTATEREGHAVAGRLTVSIPASDKPSEDPEAVGDPYKTLFIARLVSHCGASSCSGSAADSRCHPLLRRARKPARPTSGANLKCTAGSSASASCATRRARARGMRLSCLSGRGI